MRFKANGTAIKSARIEVELENGTRWTYELMATDQMPAAVWVTDEAALWLPTKMPSGNTLMMPSADPDQLELKLSGSKVEALLTGPDGRVMRV